MEAPAVGSALAGLVTLREIAPRVGSYFSAYNLAAAGRFGPAILVGRTQLFDRVVVERVIEERRALVRHAACTTR
jgi:hypothetical protein